MKKFFSMVLVLVMAMSLFTGCGTKEAGKNKDGKVVITVGGWPTEEGPTLDAMNETLEKFHEKYGDTIEVVPDTWTFSLDTFLVKAASGQLPTVYGTHLTETERIINAGYAADITNQVKKFGYEGKFNKNVETLETDLQKYIYQMWQLATELKFKRIKVGIENER